MYGSQIQDQKCQYEFCSSCGVPLCECVCMCVYACVNKTERQRDWRPHKHLTSLSVCWFSVPRHSPSRQKAYQCKTKRISLRRRDIENETGESTKPDGIWCEAFQISADMQSINIQLGCVMFCFYIFVCLRLETITAFCTSPFPLGRRADRTVVPSARLRPPPPPPHHTTPHHTTPHTHTHTHKLKLTHSMYSEARSPLHFFLSLFLLESLTMALHSTVTWEYHSSLHQCPDELLLSHTQSQYASLEVLIMSHYCLSSPSYK